MIMREPTPGADDGEFRSIEDVFGEVLELRPDLQRQVNDATMRELIERIAGNEAAIVNFLDDNLIDVDGLRELLIQMNGTNEEAERFNSFVDKADGEIEQITDELMNRLNRLMQMGQAVKTIACAMTGALLEAQKQVVTNIAAADKLTEQERQVFIAAADAFLGEAAFYTPDTDIDMSAFEKPAQMDNDVAGIETVGEVAGKLLDTTLGKKYDLSAENYDYSVLRTAVQLAAIMGTTNEIGDAADKALDRLKIPAEEFYENAAEIIDFFNDYR